MLAGADCIDDLDVVGHGGMTQLFDGIYAPRTLGSFLREFRRGHLRQLGALARQFLLRLPGAEAVIYVDVDSLLRRVYGRVTQGAGFEHTKVGGCPVRGAWAVPADRDPVYRTGRPGDRSRAAA